MRLPGILGSGGGRADRGIGWTFGRRTAVSAAEFDVFSKYSYHDSYTAELADAEFDPLDPDDPTTPETGNNTIGETRQRFDFRPEFSRGFLTQHSWRLARVPGRALFVRGRAEPVDYDFGEAGRVLRLGDRAPPYDRCRRLRLQVRSQEFP